MLAAPVLCVGAALWDIIGRAGAPLAAGGDVPGRVERRPGGVALNVALALAARGRAVALLAAVGRDPAGEALVAALAAGGVDCAHLVRHAGPTDRYLALEAPDGELFAAVADCAGLEAVGAGILRPLRGGALAGPGRPWRGRAVVDGNLPAPVLAALPRALAAAAAVALVPASPAKAARLGPLARAANVTLYCNRREAEALCGRGFADSRAAAAGLRARGGAGGGGDRRRGGGDGGGTGGRGRAGAAQGGDPEPDRGGRRLPRRASRSARRRAGGGGGARRGARRVGAPHRRRGGMIPLRFGAEVAAARAAGRPLVALETTIVTHGMPHPVNLETARAVEAAVRDAGAVPATIAVIDGRIEVGLAPEALAALAAGEGVRKLSRADLAVALSRGLDRRDHRRRHHDLRPARRHRGLRHRRHRRRAPRRRDELRHLRRPRGAGARRR